MFIFVVLYYIIIVGDNMKNKNSSKIAIVFEIILIIISVGYFIYSLIFIKDSQLFNIINSFLLVFFAVMLLLNQLTNKRYYKINYEGSSINVLLCKY